MAKSSGPFKLDEYVISHVSDSDKWYPPIGDPVKLPEFISLQGVMLVLASSIMVYLFCFVYDKKAKIPKGMTNFLEMIVLFIRNEISIASLGKEDGEKMAPLFCTFFFFILILNLIGLIPNMATATANYSVTGGLALITLYFMIFGAIQKNGIKGFIGSLIPSGVPFFVVPLIFGLEFIGLFIKTFALTVRLFANLLAGHVILFSLLGLVALLGPAALPSIVLTLFVYVLEILVAFIQAYIFTLLSAVFIGLTYHPDH